MHAPPRSPRHSSWGAAVASNLCGPVVYYTFFADLQLWAATGSRIGKESLSLTVSTGAVMIRETSIIKSAQIVPCPIQGSLHSSFVSGLPYRIHWAFQE